MPDIFFIMTKPLPKDTPERVAWWHMEFVTVNTLPTPFPSEEAARAYMAAWNMTEPQYSVWHLSKVEAK